MNVKIRILLVLLSLSLVGCSSWPTSGKGGMAEHTDRLPGCREVHAGALYGALDQRLACANRRFDTLKRVGAQLHQPALSEQARLQSQRAWRQLTAGLRDDAVTDLTIYGALLDEIERRLLSRAPMAETTDYSSLGTTASATDLENLGHVLFASGSDVVNPADLDALKALSSMVELTPQRIIFLTGYTDDRGAEGDNFALAKARAENVKQALITLGLNKGRIQIRGRGELNPVYENLGGPGRLANRRVDIHGGFNPPEFAGGALSSNLER